MFYRSKKPHVFLAILMICLVSTACSQSNSQSDPSPTPKSASLPTRPALPTRIEITSTMIPEAEATPTQSASQTNRVEFNGVGFEFPIGLFSNVKPQIAPLETGDPNTPGWPGPVPEHYLFEFEGYPLSETFHKSQILIYPIEDYAAVNPPAGDIAEKLDKELSGIIDNNADQPFLPMWNAGQVFYARLDILPFTNGEGIRYLTCYAQAILPIDNYCLFYTYQGLTIDGKYYVSAIFPINLAALEQDEVKGRFKQDFQGDEYEAYLADIGSLLSDARPEDFTPSLSDLDALVKSLVIEPNIILQSPPIPQFSCEGALPIRLEPGVRARVTFTDGTPLRLRRDPGKSGEVLKMIPEGTEFIVLEGPQCVDQGAWWWIETDNGISGWVLEGENSVYFVEPLP